MNEHLLTPLQLQVLKYYGRKPLIKGVAYDMGIAEQTVKSHFQRAYRTLDVDSIVAAYIALEWLIVPK